MMECLADRLWRFQDDTGSTSYLLAGDERVAMIDCGMGHAPVMPLIREVTRLPVTLLLTHAHPDHYGAADEFDEIWLHRRDADILPEMESRFRSLGARPFPMDRLRTFEDGAVFDLGGRQIRALPLAGHTPGSCAFADEKTRALFTGDAIGSGEIVLMAVPMALSIASYRRSLEGFVGQAERYAQGEWYGGHYEQAGAPGTPAYNPPRMKIALDMIALCDGILGGDIAGREVEEQLAPNGRALRAHWGSAGMIWLPENTND